MLKIVTELKFSEKILLLTWLLLPIVYLFLALNSVLNMQINLFFNRIPFFITMLTIGLIGFVGLMSIAFVGMDLMDKISKYFSWSDEEKSRVNYVTWGMWFSLIAISQYGLILQTN